MPHILISRPILWAWVTNITRLPGRYDFTVSRFSKFTSNFVGQFGPKIRVFMSKTRQLFNFTSRPREQHYNYSLFHTPNVIDPLYLFICLYTKERMREGAPTVFVIPPNDSLLCPLHFGVYEAPVDTPCGCTFCRRYAFFKFYCLFLHTTC